MLKFLCTISVLLFYFLTKWYTVSVFKIVLVQHFDVVFPKDNNYFIFNIFDFGLHREMDNVPVMINSCLKSWLATGNISELQSQNLVVTFIQDGT